MPDLPIAPLRTDLVSLETISLADVADMRAEPPRRHDDWHPDYPREDDCDGVGMVQRLDGWSSRAIRQLSTGLVVGSVGFFGPPEPAADGVPEAEIGYGVVAEARGHGLMRSTLPALLALTDAAGVRVRGATTLGNAASLASLRGAGFVERERPADDPEREIVLVREPR